MSKSRKFKHRSLLHRFDASLQGSYSRLLLFIVMFAVATFILTWMARCMMGDTNGYRALLSLINPSYDNDYDGVMQQVGLAVFACLGCIIFMGVLVSAVVNWVEQRRHRWFHGESRYRIPGKYSIIIGSHPVITGLVDQLLHNDENDFIIILSTKPAQHIRKQLSSIVNRLDQRRIVVYTGPTDSEEEIVNLKPIDANGIFILGDLDKDSDQIHDNKNLESYLCLCRSIECPPLHKPIPVHVMFERRATFKAFLHTDMRQEHTTSPFMFIPYNFYDLWGQVVFGAMTNQHLDDRHNYRPLDGGVGIGFSSSKYVHLVFYGINDMSEAMSLQAAHMCHFPNYCNDELGNPRTLITMIDPESDNRSKSFINLHKSLFSHSNVHVVENAAVDDGWNKDQKTDDNVLTDVAWEFIKGDIQSEVIRDYLVRTALCDDAMLTLVICHDAADMAVDVALGLPEAVHVKANGILVRQDHSSAIIDSLHWGIRSLDNIKPFGMPDSNIFSDLTNSKVAALIGLAYDEASDIIDRATDSELRQKKNLIDRFCESYSNTLSDRLYSLLDHADDNILPKSGKPLILRRYSNIYHAYSLNYRKRSFGLKPAKTCFFDADMPELLAMVEHNRWITEQLIAGYYPLHDNEARSSDNTLNRLRHKNLKSFAKLPDSTQLLTMMMSSVAPIIFFLKQKHFIYGNERKQ